MDWNWPPEVTVAVIGLIGILLGTIAGGAVSLITTQLSRRDQALQRAEDRAERAEEAKRQDDRWLAEFFMTSRVDALKDTMRRLRALDQTVQNLTTVLERNDPTYAMLGPYITSASQDLLDLISAFSSLQFEVPESLSTASKTTIALVNALGAKLMELHHEPTISSSTSAELMNELEAIRKSISRFARGVSQELTPPALKRFIQQ